MPRSALLLVATGVSLVLAGCTAATSEREAADAPVSVDARPSPASSASPSGGTTGSADRPAEPAETPGPTYSTWELGASPLPVGPDGFGEVRRTPPSLRVRRYPTRDLLPPPVGERFAASIGPITPALRRRMGRTWAPDCPVALGDLRYLKVSFRGFDGAAHTGELVVAASAARGVVSVFRALYAADFPIEEMRLPTTADLDAPPTGDGNNTAALVCRPSTGQTQWSAHAYGLALDLNSFQNPYERDGLVLPELAGSYLDRGWQRPGMIGADGLVVREFARIGWSWGGDWSTLKDYQHFSALDR